jgi:hypothetical protein
LLSLLRRKRRRGGLMDVCCTRSYYVINTNRINSRSVCTLIFHSPSQIIHKFLNLDTALERLIWMCLNILVLLRFALHSLSPAESVSTWVCMNGSVRAEHCLQS